MARLIFVFSLFLFVGCQETVNKVGSVPPDTTPPTVTGLADDNVATQSKSWSWGCDETCTYRHTINQNTSHTFSSEPYSSEITASQSSGDGTYYLHVQAKDAADNVSSVVSVSAELDNTGPSATLARANGETGVVNEAFNVTITFSESVSDFALADISVARGNGQCADRVRSQLWSHHYSR